MVFKIMYSPFAQDIRNVPNLLTLSRIGLVVAAALVFLYASKSVGMVLAVVAGVTDYLDGAVARATGKVTQLGEILDQVCDQCFESLGLLLAVSMGFFPPEVLFGYLVREFWVSGIRRYLARARLATASGLVGKLKTNFLMWGLFPTFLSLGGLLPALQPGLTYLAHAAIWLGLLFSYLSAITYTRAFVRGYDQAGEKDASSQ
jgi:CDP-diacylglycerol--glycerol-3-phosphate 3-phosphatidyltransferase